MQVVGRIDREEFKDIAPNITTDEVIITDERIAHIEKRHPGDWERFRKYVPDVLRAYDHMFADDAPNTALLLKSIEDEDGAIVELVLRLKTPQDNPEFRNSILSFWEIGQAKYRQYSRTKNFLDRKE